MIRLTWRQFRTQALVAACALVIVAIVVLVTGLNLAHLYDTTVATCKVSNDCSTATSAFLDTDSQLQTALGVLVIVIPGLIGIFWGAPLIAGEFEGGTYRLAWTQSVTRTHWLAIKLGVVGLASVVVAGLLSLMVTWWSSPIDRVTMSPFAGFDQRDIVPIGYAAFAFALGATAGLVIRRTLPAMAVSLIGFVAIRLAVYEWVRPNLITPDYLTVPNAAIAGGPDAPGQGALPLSDWIISDQTINATGQVIGRNGLVGHGVSVGNSPQGITIGGVGSCPNFTLPPPTGRAGGPAGPLTQKCVDQLHVRDALTFQPGARYWLFQWYELAIFLGLAIALILLCFWWIRRRRLG